MQKIIAIDPGYHTGYSILAKENKTIFLIAAGEIFAKVDHKQRLWHITKELIDVIESYEPFAGAIENTFVNKNPSSSLKLGMAKGAAIIALEKCKIAYEEISPSSVRKNLFKKGNLTKEETKFLIEKLFCYKFSHNITDSIAIGISSLAYSYKEYNFKIF